MTGVEVEVTEVVADAEVVVIVASVAGARDSAPAMEGGAVTTMRPSPIL